MSKFWQNLFATIDVKPKLTSSFHPQANGQTERTNQSLEQYLRHFVNHEQDNWSELLTFAEFAFNNSVSAATSTTPFFANFGFHPRSDFLVAQDVSSNPASFRFLKELKETQDRLYQNLLNSKEQMIKNQGTVNSITFEVNDLVWLRSVNLSSSRPCLKLDHRKVGPFRILRKLSPVSFQLELPESLNVHSTFHISLLEKFTPRSNEEIPLPLKTLRYRDEFLVKDVLKSKQIGSEIFYLIHWKDQSHDNDTWEPLKNLTNCLPLVRRFHKNFPNLPRPDDKLLFKRRIVLRK